MYTATVTNRVTSMMLSNGLYGSLQHTNTELQRVQEAITSGKTINKPSDEPARVSVMQFLRQRLAQHEQVNRNLQQAGATLDNIDVAMSEAGNIIIEATSIASSQIGVGSDAATRETQAEVIQSMVDAMIEIANRQYNNISIFGGRNGASPGGEVFQAFLGGLRYVGDTEALKTHVGSIHDQTFTSSGVDAFGALSSRVVSEVDLQPKVNANMRFSDIRGTKLQGVHLGAIEIDINGNEVRVELTGADTLNDVLTRVNDAISKVSAGAGTLQLADHGFSLTANAGHHIIISDVGTGIAASDLGINLDANSTTELGGDIHAKLTGNTLIADLNATVDWTSGILVTQGPLSVELDFSSAVTVQDLINEVQRHNIGLRMIIDEQAGTLAMVSEVSGVAMAIGENGGTTATDLGLRSLDRNTSLDLFRLGKGVETWQGREDLRVSLHDGRGFEVNLDSASNLGDVIDLINAARDGAGVAPADFEISMPTTGNGVMFRDNTVGTDDFRMDAIDESKAALHLGIAKNAGNAGEIVMEDTAQVRVENVFTHLMDLRDSLASDDAIGITVAGGRLQSGVDRLTQARAKVGVDARRVSDLQDHSSLMKNTEQAMLSDIQDADVTEMITRFTQLQQQLLASMQIGSHTLNTSLLDYL